MLWFQTFLQSYNRKMVSIYFQDFSILCEQVPLGNFEEKIARDWTLPFRKGWIVRAW